MGKPISQVFSRRYVHHFGRSAIFTASMFEDVAAALVAGLLSVVVCAYLYATWTHGCWSALGVRVPRPPVPLFGHTMDSMLGRVHFMDVLRGLYDELGDDRFGGIYNMRTPQLLVKDPELVGHIMVRDFEHFTDRGLYVDINTNPLNNNMFFTGGQRWKTMRQKLSPAFTANKLRHMDGQVKECSQSLLTAIDRSTTAGGLVDMEIRDTMAKYSTDVIGMCAFGLRLDAIDDPDSEFRRHGRAVFRPSFQSKFHAMVLFIQPSVLNFLRMHRYSSRTIDFFRDVFRQTIEYRERQDESAAADRNDIVEHLLRARRDLVLNAADSKSEEKFTEMDIVANAYILFVAGFETVSTTMSFCLYELALRHDIQEKVRKEILDVKSKYDGKLNYETTNELRYLNMVLKETLRKYPPLLVLSRVVTKPYLIPGTDITLKTGTKIVIPAHCLHYDSKYYPDPETFDPERFSNENVHNLHPNTYMPFGEGPRYCIGKRFAEFEMKMALSAILLDYEVSPCSKTQIPIKYVIGSVLNLPESVWLTFKKLD